MKTLLALTLVISAMLSASTSHAFGAREFGLVCQSRTSQIAISILRSQADGIQVTSLSFQGENVKGDTLSVQKPDESPSKISFVAEEKIVSLILATNVIEGALKGNSSALIVVDGQVESAKCY